jgi:ATP10 protein
MMRTLALLLAICGGAASAQTFPATQGETLAGKKVSLPGAFGGQATVVIVGFTHASQKQTKAWGERLRGQLPVWSIAVLEDAPRMVRGMAAHGIKSGTPKEDYDRFVLVYRGEKELKAAAEFAAPDDAYVMVVNGAGAIRWRFHGPVTDAAVDQARANLGH